MKKIFVCISLFGMSLLNISCYDVLDCNPLDSYTDANVWNDPVLIDAFVASQYMYTPVLVNDATTVFNSWSGSPMNRDPRSSDMNYFFGNSSQVFGARLTLDITDETKYTSDSWADLSQYKYNGITENGGMLEYWENAYYTIRNLNEIIERLPYSPIEPELADVRIAEARFLRGFIYFSMVKRYGGVPLITQVTRLDSPEELLYPKRSSEKEVYDFVIKEMDDIKESLENVDDYGRATKWAALALKSRAALYAGSIAKYGSEQLNGLLGFPKELSQEYFQKAYDACMEIKNSSRFALYNEDADKVQNFKNIFLKKKNCEAIMVKQHGGPGFNTGGGLATWSWDTMQCPNPQVWNSGNMNAPYLEMVEEFEYVDGTPGKLDREYVSSKLWNMEDLWANRDPRFYASIWTNGTEWKQAYGQAFGEGKIDMHIGLRKPDGTIITHPDESYNGVTAVGFQCDHHVRSGVINTGFGIMKYLDPEANNMLWLAESRTDYIIFRYGEIILNMAEAAYELGKVDEALTLVNQIRNRAGVKELSSINMDKIKHERKVELAFENHRYWDLRRWRDACQSLSCTFTGLRYVYDYETGKFLIQFIDKVDGELRQPKFFDHNYYFPITPRRIGANPNLLENPGY